MIDLAILNLRPGAQWILNGDNYEGLQWLDENQTKPTIEEIDAEVVRLEEEFNNKEYQRLRKSEYPSFEDQFDILYHGGYDAWKSVIDFVKNKYPKPE